MAILQIIAIEIWAVEMTHWAMKTGLVTHTRCCVLLEVQEGLVEVADLGLVHSPSWGLTEGCIGIERGWKDSKGTSRGQYNLVACSRELRSYHPCSLFESWGINYGILCQQILQFFWYSLHIVCHWSPDCSIAVRMQYKCGHNSCWGTSMLNCKILNNSPSYTTLCISVKDS